MNERLSEKQIAQLYYLDDIIKHEVIIDAYEKLKKQNKEYSLNWTRTDIMYQLCNIAIEDDLSKMFNLNKRDISEIIRTDYQTEVEELMLISKS